jgi:hypothetical protein
MQLKKHKNKTKHGVSKKYRDQNRITKLKNMHGGAGTGPGTGPGPSRRYRPTTAEIQNALEQFANTLSQPVSGASVAPAPEPVRTAPVRTAQAPVRLAPPVSSQPRPAPPAAAPLVQQQHQQHQQQQGLATAQALVRPPPPLIPPPKLGEQQAQAPTIFRRKLPTPPKAAAQAVIPAPPPISLAAAQSPPISLAAAAAQSQPSSITAQPKPQKGVQIASAAAAAPVATSVDVFCFDRLDHTNGFGGIPYTNFLSDKPYSDYIKQGLHVYSDHAPIIYDFRKIRFKSDFKLSDNPYNLITWNVAQFGNQKYPEKLNPSSFTYNHKFYMKDLESEHNYMQRLINLASAMKTLLDNNISRTKNVNYEPFLFCQELPKPSEKTLRAQFNLELGNKNLELITDVTQNSEFGIITRKGHSQKFTVIPKTSYWDYTYGNDTLIFPHVDVYSNNKKDNEWKRFEIYFYTVPQKGANTLFFYYVNVHAFFYAENKDKDKDKATELIIDFLNRILDVIHIYHFSNNGNINNITVYIIGDFNYNMLSPEINTYVRNYQSRNPQLNYTLFGNQFLVPPRKVKIYKMSTDDAIGYSLKNNIGEPEPCNVDCLLKIDFIIS